MTLLAGAAMMFSACDKESYMHRVEVVYPESQALPIYADQTVDSISFLTYDSYHCYPYQGNPDNFISLGKDNLTKKINNVYGMGYIFTLPVYFSPNPDSVRVGHVAVESKSEMDEWTATTYGTYMQVPWHCISRPSPVYFYDRNQNLKGCDHILRDSALQTTDTLKFYAYDKWTIESSNPEIIAPKRVKGDRSSRNLNEKVPFDVAPNLTKDTLRTTLTLKSENGATTIIKFVQAPRKSAN